MAEHVLTGHVRVEERARGRRVWIAEYQRADGSRTPRRSGRRGFARRASGQRAAPCCGVPATAASLTRSYLTPAEANERLARLLDAERRRPAPAVRAPKAKTLRRGDRGLPAPLRARRRRGGDDPARLPRGERHARGRRCPARDAGADDHRRADRRLPGASCSPRPSPGADANARPSCVARPCATAMLVLSGILQRARAKEWIAANPARGDTDRRRPGRQPRLQRPQRPSRSRQVAALIVLIADGRAAADAQRARSTSARWQSCAKRRAVCAEAVRLAAYTGLRFGELRDLRWRDIDRTGPQPPRPPQHPDLRAGRREVKAPKGRRGRSLPLIDQAVAVLWTASSRPGIRPVPTTSCCPTSRAACSTAGKVRTAFYRGLAARRPRLPARPRPTRWSSTTCATPSARSASARPRSPTCRSTSATRRSRRPCATSTSARATRPPASSPKLSQQQPNAQLEDEAARVGARCGRQLLLRSVVCGLPETVQTDVTGCDLPDLATCRHLARCFSCCAAADALVRRDGFSLPQTVQGCRLLTPSAVDEPDAVLLNTTVSHDGTMLTSLEQDTDDPCPG